MPYTAAETDGFVLLSSNVVSLQHGKKTQNWTSRNFHAPCSCKVTYPTRRHRCQWCG